MSARIYGRIRLTEADLGTIRRMLARGLETVELNLATASENDERRYYQTTRDRYESELTRFTKVKPGAMPFTEDDLTFVRGSIFPVLKPELMARWAAKHELDAAEVASLSAEIDDLEVLEGKFAQPFLKDHSQDAAPDEEDSDEDDTDFAPSA